MKIVTIVAAVATAPSFRSPSALRLRRHRISGTSSRSCLNLKIRPEFACARRSRPCLLGSCPNVSATLTTMAFDHSHSRWFGIGYLIAEPEGPSFISSTVT